MVSHREASMEGKFTSDLNSIHKTRFCFGIIQVTVFKQMLFFIPSFSITSTLI